MASKESPNEIWRGGWRLFTSWARLDLDAASLTAGERWSVVITTVPAVVRSRYAGAWTRWLLARTPSWIVAWRLQRRVHGWYRIPTQRAAEQVRLRFDIWPIEVGDHVRLKGGRLTAVGYTTATFSEFLLVLANGEIEPDPASPFLVRARAAYRDYCVLEAGNSDSSSTDTPPAVN